MLDKEFIIKFRMQSEYSSSENFKEEKTVGDIQRFGIELNQISCHRKPSTNRDIDNNV